MYVDIFTEAHSTQYYNFKKVCQISGTLILISNSRARNTMYVIARFLNLNQIGYETLSRPSFRPFAQQDV